MEKGSKEGLEALLRRGPTPRYAIRALVMAEWRRIEQARKLPCTWAEISVALGLRADQWRGVFRAYHKIQKDFNGAPPAQVAITAESPRQEVSRKNTTIEL